MLHGFGIKGTALSHLKGIEHRIASIDSQAYGQAARHDAFAQGIPKTDTLVAQHMQAWTASQFARLRGAPVLRQSELFLPQSDPTPADPWEQAIAQARAEIRSLVEDGDIGHEDVTTLWVEQWAADIYRDSIAR